MKEGGNKRKGNAKKKEESKWIQSATAPRLDHFNQRKRKT